MAPTTQAEELRELAGRLARLAGELLASSRPGESETGTKSSPTDLVTAADRAAERLIIEELRAVRPDDAVLAEEGGGRAGTSGIRWVVDPLDGMLNFVYGIPFFGVSIAAEAGGALIAAPCTTSRTTSCTTRRGAVVLARTAFRSTALKRAIRRCQ